MTDRCNLQEVDEDNPEPSLTGPPLGGPDGGGGSNSASATNSNANLDILSIAEQHREKSKSQQDLKRQFEEFSRNLSLGRSR